MGCSRKALDPQGSREFESLPLRRMKILLVEDNEKLAQSITLGLQQEGHHVDYLLDGASAEQRILQRHSDYDVIILDVMLPQRDGIMVCQTVRAHNIVTPILMLTAKDTVQDRVAGLDSGADDYVVKPFSFVELVARLKALQRRPKELTPLTLTVGPLTLNSSTRLAQCNGHNLVLTLKEFQLLEYFMRHPNIVFTREQILEQVWNSNGKALSNIVDVHIKNLRKKLNDYQRDQNLLETIRGLGYRLKS